jgi:hypothetical protein
LELLHNKYIHAITGTRDSLAASIGEIIKIGAVNGRILQTIIPLLFTLPQRHNMKQVSKWSGFNENIIHNWYDHQLDLCDFNRMGSMKTTRSIFLKIHLIIIKSKMVYS